MSEWQSKELSPQEFTICIVTLKLQKRQNPELERFAENECCVKLFQVSVSNGSPKTPGVPDMTGKAKSRVNCNFLIEIVSIFLHDKKTF